MSDYRLVMVSNRLPVVITKNDEGISVHKGSGGLVTAIAPVLKDRGGLWIGWTGAAGLDIEEVNRVLKQQQKNIGFSLLGIDLTQQEIDDYYMGFSNELIWPLFHDLPSQCIFEPRYWHVTQEVIDKFAKAVIGQLQPNDFLWVHDYQLLILGQELRKKGVQLPIAFFLHIPFPPLDIFIKLPWRFQILRAILEYDLIGFQTLRDVRNFTQCVRLLLPECRLAAGKNRSHTLTMGERKIKIGAFPISINYNEFADAAASEEVEREAWIFHEKLKDQQIVFSLDRLDLTKGITYRLEAIRNVLQKHPEMHKQVTFIQVVVPSRAEIPGYQNLKQRIDRLVSDINSQFTKDMWVPIHYIYRSLSREELVMHYRSAEVCLVTPVKDGMNLVCKEYIAANVNGNGVLILSEFAGAASQLFKDALLINPYDIEGTSEAIYKALTMPDDERRARMARMKRIIRKQDIFYWLEHFLSAAFSKDLHDFPVVTDYLPVEEKTPSDSF